MCTNRQRTFVTLIGLAIVLLKPIGSAATNETPRFVGQSITQINHFVTGYDTTGVPLLIPAIDPAGIAFHAPSGHLFIADSEINEVTEVFNLIGANIFEVSLSGDTIFSTYNTTLEGNNEPTGITFNTFDGHFYMSNDDAKKVYRYALSTSLSIVDEVSTIATAGSGDPEGITSDPNTGWLYVVDGVGNLIVVYSYDQLGSQFVLEDVLDLAFLNDPGLVPTDPEGIAFDPFSGHLFVVSDPDNAIYEMTTTGIVAAKISLSALSPPGVAPQGLTFGTPSQVGPTNPTLYFADGGIDNDSDPNERDGAVYEVSVVDDGTTNQPPVLSAVPDQSIDEAALLSFTVTGSDPDPTDNLTYSLVGFVPSGATIGATTGVFTWTPSESQGPKVYTLVVRVSDDGAFPLHDQQALTVTVSEVNTSPILDPIGDQTASEGVELTFTATASDPDLLPDLSEGLVAYWPFDTDFSSSTGNYNGTPVNGAAITINAGEFVLGGGALNLDGVDDYVDFGDMPLPGDLTVAAWVDPENIAITSASHAVVLGDGGNADWIRIETNGVRAKFNDSTKRMPTDPDFVNNAWQHFALVRTAGSATVYRNGLVVASGSQSNPFTPEFIGLKTSGSNYFAGRMDDVAVWNRPLSTADILMLYGSGVGQAVGDLTQIPANNLIFSLEGNVPQGAGIDPGTGAFSWMPNASQSPGVFVFQVRVTDDGSPQLFDEETISVAVDLPTGIGDGGVPRLYELRASAPNPFSSSTTIVFVLPEETSAELAIFDVSGRLVRRLVQETLPVGIHRATWDGTTQSGDRAATGVYLYRLKTRSFTQTRKMIVVR